GEAEVADRPPRSEAAEDAARARVSRFGRPVEAEPPSRHLREDSGAPEPARPFELLVEGLGPARHLVRRGKEARMCRHPTHGPGVVVVHLARVPDLGAGLVGAFLAKSGPAR